MPPIAIFPEGTVSNGKAILEFKMGPFKDFKPLKILAFKVPYTRFSPYDDFILPQLSTILLLMSNWCNTCTLYEFEGVFDPAYLKLDQSDRNSWKVFADKVRTIIANVLEIEKMPLNYKHLMEFGTIYNLHR